MKRPREPEDTTPALPSHASHELHELHESPASPTIDSQAETRPPVQDDPDYSQPRAKIVGLSSDADGPGRDPEPTAMACLLHRERVEFPSYKSYEAHYNSEHLHRCVECRRNFPSPLYLKLHGDECHDPFIAVRRDRGEHTFACFVDGCERKCASSDKRRRHLIDKHGFPKTFFFSITQLGTDGRQSLLNDDGRRWHHRRLPSAEYVAKKEARRRAASLTKPEAGTTTEQPDDVAMGGDEARVDVEAGAEPSASVTKTATKTATETEKPDVGMDDLSSAMSALAFVPRSVRFGRGGKASFARKQ